MSNEQLLNGEEACPSDGIQFNGWDSQAEQNLKAMSKSRRSKMEATGKTNWTTQGVALHLQNTRGQSANAKAARPRLIARGAICQPKPKYIHKIYIHICHLIYTNYFYLLYIIIYIQGFPTNLGPKKHTGFLRKRTTSESDPGFRGVPNSRIAK